MKYCRYLFLLLLLLLLPICVGAQQKSKIKVACIGNSITYGAFIANVQENSYPAQLQAYLGSEYEVRNFGVSATTVLSKGNYPYTTTKEYAASHEFLPDIVLIKFGTNDTKPQNWKYKDEFIADYQQLIDSYRTLSSHPRIILLPPIRCFLEDESSINPRLIETNVRPMVEELAWKNQIEIINLFNLFGDKWESYLMPDRLHPSAIGAGEMAYKIGAYLKQNYPVSTTEQLACLNEAKPFNFHGHQGYDFQYEGVDCKIVKPTLEAEGKPWVMRARFWGHEPQTDIALLEHGFHIMYCDVADLYGSERAVERWNRFYQLMRKNGFEEKVVLEGMSRGGLIVYNWAAHNPSKVACIYADAPVMDFKSWPMGKGKSAGSESDVKLLFAEYGFKDEAEALAWNHNPIDHAAIIARAKIPCLHVVGDVDDVVPVSENTSIFEKRMQELCAPIAVIHKPDVNHHPHSLNNPKPIVDFILSATHRRINECAYPVPGNEYRQAAGWTEDAEWHAEARDIQEVLQGRQLRLLLVGNSITQGWGGNRKAVAYKPGKEPMDSVLGKDTWETAGISGDRTQNVLWRLQNYDYNCCKPTNVVIAIGVNNFVTAHDEADDVAEGIIAVTQEAERCFPESNIILLGLLPSGKEKRHPVRQKCDCVYTILQQQHFVRAHFYNPTSWFVTNDGTIRDGLYSGDYIHLTAEGYRVMAAELLKLMR